MSYHKAIKLCAEFESTGKSKNFAKTIHTYQEQQKLPNMGMILTYTHHSDDFGHSEGTTILPSQGFIYMLRQCKRISRKHQEYCVLELYSRRLRGGSAKYPPPTVLPKYSPESVVFTCGNMIQEPVH